MGLFGATWGDLGLPELPGGDKKSYVIGLMKPLALPWAAWGYYLVTWDYQASMRDL